MKDQLDQEKGKAGNQLQIHHLEEIIEKKEKTIEEILSLNSILAEEKAALIQDMEELRNEAILALTAVTSSAASHKNDQGE